MFPRILTIALAILASSDVAFGRVGTNELRVFASRPVGNSSNHLKAGSKGHRALSESHHDGKFDEEVGNLLDVGKRSWSELWKEMKGNHHDIVGMPSAEDHVHDERHHSEEQKDHHGSGRLRKLQKLTEVEEESDVSDGMNINIPG